MKDGTPEPGQGHFSAATQQVCGHLRMLRWKPPASLLVIDHEPEIIPSKTYLDWSSSCSALSRAGDLVFPGLGALKKRARNLKVKE